MSTFWHPDLKSRVTNLGGLERVFTRYYVLLQLSNQVAQSKNRHGIGRLDFKMWIVDCSIASEAEFGRHSIAIFPTKMGWRSELESAYTRSMNGQNTTPAYQVAENTPWREVKY